VKLSRHVALVIVAGAALVALASCGKSTSVTRVAAIDSAPLMAPDGIAATYNAGTVQDFLRWSPSSSPSVAGYQVYESVTNPTTGGIPTRIATTASSVNSLMLPAVSATCTKFYQVCSIDAAGNASSLSAPVAVLRHALPAAADNGGGSAGVAGGSGKLGD